MSLDTDDQLVDQEIAVLMRELESVELSLKTLHRKNQFLKQQSEDKQKLVQEQKRIVDMRQT